MDKNVPKIISSELITLQEIKQLASLAPFVL